MFLDAYVCMYDDITDDNSSYNSSFFCTFFFQVVYYCTCTVLYFCISILLLALQLAGTWVGSFCPVGISLFNIYPDTLKFGICTL